MKIMYFQLGNKDYLFRFRAMFFSLCILFILLFCWLGVWQIHRYHFKKTLVQTHRQTQVVEGDYQNAQTMFIQNKFYNNRPGFEVLTPLKLAGEKKLLLVDRGWIAEPLNHQLPVLDKVKGLQKVSGHVRFLNEYQFILGPNIPNPLTVPLVMQKININELSQLTHEEFYPYILQLDKAEPNGFAREWLVSAMTPEHHLGYAMQWFLMALVLFTAYLCFSIERVSHNESES